MRIVEGAFVRVLFPTDEKPRQPGLLHIGYCLGTDGKQALVAYTTSKPWPPDTIPPQGVVIFDRQRARTLNQKPFVLDLARLARLPLTDRWFPDIGTPTNGVIAQAGATLRAELFSVAQDLLRRHREVLKLRGP